MNIQDNYLKNILKQNDFSIFDFYPSNIDRMKTHSTPQYRRFQRASFYAIECVDSLSKAISFLRTIEIVFS